MIVRFAPPAQNKYGSPLRDALEHCDTSNRGSGRWKAALDQYSALCRAARDVSEMDGEGLH